MRREGDEGHGPGGEDRWTVRREGPSPKLWILFGVMILLVIFVLQNTDRQQIDFLFWNGVFPLWTMIVVAAVLGVIGGWVVGRIGGAERRARKAERRDE